MASRTTLRLLRVAQRGLCDAAAVRPPRSVPLALIKEVRARSGAPLASVRDALEASGCDVDGALEHLRRSGARLAASRAARPAGEGLVGVGRAGGRAALVELRCETDFVARTGVFYDVLGGLVRSALGGGGRGEVGGAALAERDGNAGRVAEAAGVLGENVGLGRVWVVEGGGVGTYVHGRVARPEDAREEVVAGRIGVAVAMEGGLEVADRLAMHVAAEAPLYVHRGEVPEEVLRKETDILMEAARGETVKPGAKPRPDDILMKMVQGRLGKWVGEVSLEEQMMLGSEADVAGGKAVAVKKWLGQVAPGARIESFARLSIL